VTNRQVCNLTTLYKQVHASIPCVKVSCKLRFNVSEVPYAGLAGAPCKSTDIGVHISGYGKQTDLLWRTGKLSQ